MDWTKHDYLKIPHTELGKIYSVLSIGFFGKMKQPNITVEENNQVKCYLLPLELLNWSMDCVAIANVGGNVFPSRVQFGVINNQYYAEIM